MSDESTRIQALIDEAEQVLATMEAMRSRLPLPGIDWATGNLKSILRQLKNPQPLNCPRCGARVELDAERSNKARLIYNCPCLKGEERLSWSAVVDEGRLTIVTPQDKGRA